jgi:hypothetical protein
MRQIAGLILVVVLAACTSSTTGAPGSVGGSGNGGPAVGTASAGPASAGPAAGGNGALPADPCAALTLDELKTVTGKAFQPGVKSGSGTDCEWTQQGGNGVVEVDFKRLDKDVFSLLAKGSANIPVPGVGDQALIIPIISAIDVAKGGVEFTIQPILVASGDGWKQIATDLAKLVAGRVGG